jgi:hypothetical protein
LSSFERLHAASRDFLGNRLQQGQAHLSLAMSEFACDIVETGFAASRMANLVVGLV